MPISSLKRKVAGGSVKRFYVSVFTVNSLFASYAAMVRFLLQDVAQFIHAF